MIASSFVFVQCQVGAEPALKRELARGEATAAWRPAFSRPGLVTFKLPAPATADLALEAVFARAFGLSLGRAADAAAVAALWRAQLAQIPVQLHVSERDLAGPGEEPLPYGPRAAAFAAEIVSAGVAVTPLSLAPGQLVLDVVVAPDEPALVGVHTHHGGHSPHPGGRSPVVLPPEAPSRAYLKLEEALGFSGYPVAAGQVAVEIGSAPGGASHALLVRGLTVVGVDPGDMDPRVLAHPAFTHRKTTLGDVRREALPPRVDWLVMDVNLAPQVALHGVRRLVPLLAPALRGVIFTLKLNDWAMADEVPSFLARVAGMGLTDVRATQLPTNRREICVVARAAAPGRAATGSRR